MPESQNIDGSRTIRPEGTGLTVRRIISLPEVAIGRPEIVAGSPGLERPVRWVHVLEAGTVAPFVSGHELVLSTGRGWPTDAELPEYVASLIAANVAGLIIELGTRFRSVPQDMLDACNVHELPLIALHVPTKFVAITEAVHRNILATHLVALRTRDKIHARFAEVIRNGAPSEYIVQEAARLLGAPLALEDLAHRLVIFAGAGDSEESSLLGWRTCSRTAHEQGNTGRLAVPVEARRHRWGYLVTLEGRPQTEEAELILGQAAIALALELLASQGTDPWLRVRHERLLEILLERRLASWDDVAQRLEASGFPTRQRELVGIAMRIQRSEAQEAEQENDEVIQALLDAADGLGVDLICARAASASPAIVAALSLRVDVPESVALVNEIITRCHRRVNTHLTTAGFAGADVSELAESLDEALQLLSVAGPTSTPSPVVIRRSSNQELPMLLHNLHSDPRSQSFVERALGPLIRNDAQHGTDLLQVLAAFLEHPENRTLAAAESHLSRSVFYQRLSLIEKRLGYRLNNGAKIASLYTALIIYRQSNP